MKTTMIALILAGLFPDGSETTPKNYLNDPFVPQETINWLNEPESWPIFFNRGPLDRSPKEKSSKLITLGTGNPAPNPYRYGPSHVLIVNNYPYFVDCGEGWWRGLAKATLTQNFIDLTKVF